jgi:hypothetical protein
VNITSGSDETLGCRRGKMLQSWAEARRAAFCREIYYEHNPGIIFRSRSLFKMAAVISVDLDLAR